MENLQSHLGFFLLSTFNCAYMKYTEYVESYWFIPYQKKNRHFFGAIFNGDWQSHSFLSSYCDTFLDILIHLILLSIVIVLLVEVKL